ncbi:MAG: MarR family winged helix-turn-helix transcriptional regulator [Nocardioidaceae bacterium]
MEDPADWSTGRLLSTAARLVEHAWTSHLNRLGITHAGLIALHVLAAGADSQRALASRCQVQAQTMGRIIKRLESSGLVQRRPDPQDGRKIQVQLTRAGRDALSVATTSRPDFLGLLDDDDGRNFREQLIEIVGTLGDQSRSKRS